MPSHWQARLIEVSVGSRVRRFITSLPCPRTHPAHELAELYRAGVETRAPALAAAESPFAFAQAESERMAGPDLVVAIAADEQ